MDISNIPIVNRCTAVSQNIYDYFLEERYKTIVEQEEEITETFLSYTAIQQVLDELDILGVISSLDESDIYYSELDLQTMLYLRIKLDKDNLLQAFKNMTDKQYAELKQLVEDCILSEDLLLELVDYMTVVYPLDTIWDLINRSIDYWGSEEAFAKHIHAILKQVDEMDRNNTYVDDNNLGDITSYLGRMQQREIQLKACVNFVLKSYPSLDTYQIVHLVNRYDKDKLNPDLLPLFASYKEVEGQPEPSYVKHHHESTPHHLQYWEKLHDTHEQLEIKGPIDTLSNEQCVMAVLSFVLDGMDNTQMLKEVEKFKPYALDEQYLLLRQLAQIDYNKLLTGE